jgi:hypothetical protein
MKMKMQAENRWKGWRYVFIGMFVLGVLLIAGGFSDWLVAKP